MHQKAFPVIDPVATGANIVRLRTERGLSVRDLQAYFGFEEPQAIYKWQKGKSLPSVDNLYALSALLEVPMDEILVSARPRLNIVVCEQQAGACCSPLFGSAFVQRSWIRRDRRAAPALSRSASGPPRRRAFDRAVFAPRGSFCPRSFGRVGRETCVRQGGGWIDVTARNVAAGGAAEGGEGSFPVYQTGPVLKTGGILPCDLYSVCSTIVRLHLNRLPRSAVPAASTAAGRRGSGRGGVSTPSR